MDIIENVSAAAPKAGSQGFVNDVGTEFDFGATFSSLGSFTNKLVPLAFSIAALMVVFYFIIGAFEMITSQGDKAHIVSARSKIYHSIIGFILLIVLFIAMEYLIPAILGQDQVNPIFRII